jgi:hypothetical protein
MNKNVILMKYLMFLFILLSSCSHLFHEPSNQERITLKSERIREEDKKPILLNPMRFDSLAYYPDTIREIPQQIAPKGFMGSLTETGLNIVGYGTIQYGSRIHSSEDNDVIEIIDSLLFVPIIDGGGHPISPQTKCDLIWDGNYHTNSEGEIYVNLVFSYVNPDIRRAIVRRTLQFDLSQLKHPDVKRIKVRILGYVHDLYYSY